LERIYDTSLKHTTALHLQAMNNANLLGGWRPHRWEWNSSKTGELLYATSNLEGLLIYASDGSMSVRVRSTRGPALKVATSTHGETLVLRAKRWMVATPGFQWGYFGRYEIDAENQEVLHYAEMRTRFIPREPVLRRKFSLESDLLCLEYTDRGAQDRLFWRRAAVTTRERELVSVA
jgi:hypothetical protein